MRTSPVRLTTWVVAALLVAAAVAACGSASDPAPPGAASARLDPAFGQDGVAIVSFGAGYAEASDVVVDRQGRAVVAGRGPGDTGILLRLRPDGSPDLGFGDRSQVRTPLDSARAVALTPDGAIVVAGSKDGGLAVARYAEDGALDRSFGTDGVSVIGFAGQAGGADAVAIDPGGTITAGGSVSDPTDLTTRSLALVRYRPNGAVDDTFGDQGRVHVPTRLPLLNPNAMGVDGEGRTVVAGAVEQSQAGQPANQDAGLFRYAPDGRADTSFGTDGAVVVDLGSPFDVLNGVLIAGPDRIIGIGSSNPSGHGVQAALVTTNGDGGDAGPLEPDGAFSVPLAPLSEAFSALTRGDGGLLVLARVADDRVSSDPGWEWALAEYGAGGAPVPGFGQDGVLRSAIGNRPNAMATAPDGAVVVVGCTCPDPPTSRGGPESESSFVIARYALTGS